MGPVGTPYGVRRNRIGSGPTRSVGVRITVCNRTPSRIGIITSSNVKAGVADGCCARAVATSSSVARTLRR